MYEVVGADIPMLVHQLRLDNHDARRKLIEGFVGLAFNVASAYDDDEALSAALYELVIVVDNFKNCTSEPGTFLSYVENALERACIRACLRGHTRLRNKKSVATDMMASGSLLTERHHRLRTNGDVPQIDQFDLVLGCCDGDVQRKIARMAAMGYSGVEISGCLKVSTATVTRHMQAIEVRFKVQERNLR